jgi:AraC family transcriptional regulator, regulatory protein of adaptative response / DNA-3-methyladenine glycosylase II
MDLDRDACYRALRTRDARFDGRFFTGVRTTGIFCRPVCPARLPRLENCVFLPSAAAALAAGFRPCLRCRPETSPDVAAWHGTSSTVRRALALIAGGALDEDGDVAGLASRLGVGERHLRRLFRRHLGASPIAVAQARRLLFAKTLIDETRLPMTQVALAAGYGSVRRFQATMRRAYGRAPLELRASRREEAAGSSIALRLAFRPPYDWPALLAFLAARAIPGVEAVAGERYLRTFAIGASRGVVEVARVPGADRLRAEVRSSDVTELAALVPRLFRVLDLGADPVTIGEHLSQDPLLAPLVAARPGLRVPGAWEGFELAVRAILGQQVTVGAATGLAGRLVAAYGEPLGTAETGGVGHGLRFVFPQPARLADADLASLGMPRARAAAISSLAAAVAADARFFDPARGLDAAVERLRALPGIGEWTAQYIAMRVLREPDAFPAGDVGLQRATAGTATQRPTPAALLARAEAWRPWRAYAALHLWTSLASPKPTLDLEIPHAPVPRRHRIADRDLAGRLRRHGSAVRARFRRS